MDTSDQHDARAERRHRGRPVRTRDDLESLAQDLLDSAWRHASPSGALVQLPGAEGGYGARIDGLEGFARTFLMAGFLTAGSGGREHDDLVDRYSRGLAAGVDPDHDERWPRLTEHPQAKVEAASIALILDMTRPWIWDRLDSRTRRHVVDYLSPAVGDDTYPRINWVWFRLVVQTFLRSVGGPFSEREMREDLATHDTFVREGGWLADGAERSYDHYAGWALHLYPTLWARMAGAEDLARERGSVDRERLDRYLADALLLVGGDGSPLLQGRSLIYRFAAAAPFWVGVLADVPSHDSRALRDAAMRMVSHFAERGVPDSDGLLTMGWHDEWRPLAQAYSGPGSPYWAAKGLLGLLIPASDPLWSVPPAALPIDGGDVLEVARAPGWIIAGTRDDGIVRVINHGTDHALPGASVGDSPLYARLGYSTATSPMLDDASWRSPTDQSVALVDGDGVATHRAGFATGVLRVETSHGCAIGVGASTSTAHWLDTDAHQRHHGSGYEGATQDAGRVQVVSVVRGAWEVRAVRLVSVTEEGRRRAASLRVSGWAVPGHGADAGTAVAHPGTARVIAGDLVSTVTCAASEAHAHVMRLADASPLAAASSIPCVDLPVEPGAWTAVLIALHGNGASADAPAPGVALDADSLTVDWGDGASVIDLGDQV